MLLERGIMAGNKAERFTADGSQLTLGVLGLLLTPEVPEAPEAPAASPAASPTSPSEEAHLAPLPAKRRPTGRRAITAMLPRVDIEVLPPEVQREGLDAFDRIGEETSEVVEHRPASLVLVRIVRPKFVRKRVARDDTPVEPDESPVLIADPPERPIERGLAGPGLLASTSRCRAAETGAAWTNSWPKPPIFVLGARADSGSGGTTVGLATLYVGSEGRWRSQTVWPPPLYEAAEARFGDLANRLRPQ